MPHARCTVDVDGVPIEYLDSGTGPPVVFVHGVYVTGAVWDDVVAELGEGYRCLVPTWPLGAHAPVGQGPDLSASATAARIVHFLEALDLSDVTLVANDTGGGLVITALGDPELDFSRVGRLVFTNSDSYEHFPPGSFARIVQLCRFNASVGGFVLRLLATERGRSFFLGAVAKTTPTAARAADIFGAFATNPATRAEAVAVTASLDPALTLRAGPAIESFDRPVVLAWGDSDALFPLQHARRLAEAFPRARLVEVPGSSTFVMVDAPAAVADAVRAVIDQADRAPSSDPTP